MRSALIVAALACIAAGCARSTEDQICSFSLADYAGREEGHNLSFEDRLVDLDDWDRWGAFQCDSYRYLHVIWANSVIALEYYGPDGALVAVRLFTPYSFGPCDKNWSEYGEVPDCEVGCRIATGDPLDTGSANDCD